MTNFQRLFRYKKLPKGLKDMPAFLELKSKIDDFSQCLPLIDLMGHRSMQIRHWKQLEELVGCQFNVVDEQHFMLKDVMQAPLLAHKDEIEVTYQPASISNRL